jgi:hypothetical protein
MALNTVARFCNFLRSPVDAFRISATGRSDGAPRASPINRACFPSERSPAAQDQWLSICTGLRRKSQELLGFYNDICAEYVARDGKRMLFS